MIDEKQLLADMQAKKDELKANAPFNDEFCRGFAFAMEFVKVAPLLDGKDANDHIKSAELQVGRCSQPYIDCEDCPLEDTEKCDFTELQKGGA